MIYKILGAVFVISGCGSFGLILAAAHIKEERSLRQLIGILDYMECELQYRLTPLPTLCRQAASEGKGSLCQLFLWLAKELDAQISPDAARCMEVALSKVADIPQNTTEVLQVLGRSLGRFDLDGQLKGLDSVRHECRRKLEELNDNRDFRLRSYKTLGLCAGAAMAILFI